ncbi:MAG: hypothetical protein AB9869_02220 [Verrucomicrobiia bacterium]
MVFSLGSLFGQEDSRTSLSFGQGEAGKAIGAPVFRGWILLLWRLVRVERVSTADAQDYNLVGDKLAVLVLGEYGNASVKENTVEMISVLVKGGWAPADCRI